MENVSFGKQQFVGSVQGAVTDSYQMLKVFLHNFRKSDQAVTVESTR